jgi:hypothetical protein
MNKVIITPVTINGGIVLRRYCFKHRVEDPNVFTKTVRKARAKIQKVFPYTEEADPNSERPERLVVTLSYDGGGVIDFKKVTKNTFQALGKYGGREADFEVKWE